MRITTGLFAAIIGLAHWNAVQAQQITWEQRSDVGWDIPNGPMVRFGATAFAVGGQGYVGMGTYDGYASDLYAFDPASDTWLQRASLPAPGRA